MEKDLIEFCEKVQEEIKKMVIGKDTVYVGPVERSYGTMVRMTYGNKEYEFNPDGYNFLANVRTIMNNPVMDAVLE